jgi:hypothetical protein
MFEVQTSEQMMVEEFMSGVSKEEEEGEEEEGDHRKWPSIMCSV